MVRPSNVLTQTRERPKARLSSFAAKLRAEWRRLELPEANASVLVAVSGGADSSALLLALDELIKSGNLDLKLMVAHLDHGLRTSSAADARWVKQMAGSLADDVEVVVGKGDLKKRRLSGGKSGANLEQAARKARYEFLEKTARKRKVRLILTAHTLDDQAETVLMRLLRGTGAEGLSGIVASRPLATNSDIQLIRPLVSWARRAETEDYCVRREVDYRADEMNNDEAFSRVRVRKQLLPLMKSFNPRVVEALSRTAALLTEDAEALAAAASGLLDEAGRRPEQETGRANAREHGQAAETKRRSLDVSILLRAPSALRRRALREWILRERGDLRRIEMVHLLAVEALLGGERGGRIAELPGGLRVVRKRGWLAFSDKRVEKAVVDD